MKRTFATVAFIAAAVGSSQSSNAQTGTAQQKPLQGDVCWQNTATGQPVPKKDLVPIIMFKTMPSRPRFRFVSCTLSMSTS
ncbi:MAG TPA: hypothetical protein VN875_14850 [Candidatus Binatus sp.]|jgi:hypothetical protein|nr:hypothetical protein [Candidatus Binatus sp.]